QAEALGMTDLNGGALFNAEFGIRHRGSTVPERSGVALSFCRRLGLYHWCLLVAQCPPMQLARLLIKKRMPVFFLLMFRMRIVSLLILTVKPWLLFEWNIHP
ncbi:hypothetical protein, partial [Pseudomonas fragi]|uniref:hypothetical protein n=1 Tax=Pseudomonas fragi TaxID=296 RepID=UPI001CB6E378